MVVSRGGISGGLTIADALQEFESRGYIGQFVIREGGLVECGSCHAQHRPPDVPVEGMRRIEGVSDPADMVYVGALRCPQCEATGTATIKYGTLASREDAIVLRGLHQEERPSVEASRETTDESLVRDTGWLPGPDGR
jgi:hypothetical protein